MAQMVDKNIDDIARCGFVNAPNFLLQMGVGDDVPLVQQEADHYIKLFGRERYRFGCPCDDAFWKIDFKRIEF